jgi:hypothetical protein
MGWVFILRSQLSWLSGEEKLSLYRSSEHVERLFCSFCGCQMTYTNLERNRELAEHGMETTMDISIGTLDDHILANDRSVVPRRYAHFNDIIGWMRSIFPSEDR